MSLFERIKNKRASLQEQTTGEQEKKQERKKGADYSDQSDEIAKKKKTKYQQLRDQRTKYNVLKNKKGEYVPSIQSAKAKIGERIRNITQPPNPKATQKNALNASPGRIRKLNKAQRRAAMFEPGAGKERFNKKFDKDYGTRILDRITKNQEGKIDTSKAGRIARMKAGISAKSPTIATKIIGKDGKPQRIPMPGGPNEVDFATGGKGVNQKGIQTDRAVINRMGRDASKEEIAKAKRQQAAYDKQVRANQAKLKTPGGAKYYTGKTTPLNKGVFGLGSGSDLQKVYDDLASETQGKDRRKRYKNQPTKQQVQATIDKTYPTKQGKDTRPPRFVKGKDGVVRQYGGGKIPDKSSGAYGSANDRVAVSADKKTRTKAPNYDELIKKNKKIVKKIKTPPKVETPKVETPKVETPPKTQTAKQFDGKSFDDFIKDAKKKNKAAQQSIKNITVDPVTKFGDKLSVGNQLPYKPKRIPNPERVKKIKDYRSMLKSQPKYLRNISKFSRKNPRLRGAGVVLGTLATIAGINKLVTSGTKKPTPVAPPLTKKDIVPLTANLNLSKGNRPTFTPTKPKNT